MLCTLQFLARAHLSEHCDVTVMFVLLAALIRFIFGKTTRCAYVNCTCADVLIIVQFDGP